MSLDSKTGTVTFTDVHQGPGYVRVAYDLSGKWDAHWPRLRSILWAGANAMGEGKDVAAIKMVLDD